MGATRPTDRLFFAIVPDPDTAARIADLGRVLRKTHGLQGRAIVPEQLHITLWHVRDDFFAPPPELISTLVRRAGYVEMPSFRISFDHVMSFRNGAFVLCGEEGAAGLEILHERLQAVLALPVHRRSRSAFTPHMTLLRDERLLPLQRIEPIDWTAHEFVLVHSLLGRTTHRHLARLPLA
jgi:2'-5' RNA ligase